MFETPQDLMLFLMTLSVLFLIIIVGIAIMQTKIIRTIKDPTAEDPIAKIETGDFQADDLKRYANHPNPEIREFARQTQSFMSEMERTQRALNEQLSKNKDSKGDV